MTIFQFSDQHRLLLSVRYQPGGQWCAQFDHVDYFDGSYSSAFGLGDSFQAALLAYVQEIRGKVLRYRYPGALPGSVRTLEFKVPGDLTA